MRPEISIDIFNSSSQKHLPPDRRRSERRNSPELAAYLWIGSLPKHAGVRDISSTGVYLLTRERWAPGDTVSMTLQRKGPLEGNFDRRVVVQARAVRWGDDGIAMSFVLPTGVDLHLWESPLKSAAEQTEPEDILQEFRMATALAFLQRVSPEISTEVVPPAPGRPEQLPRRQRHGNRSHRRTHALLWRQS